MSKINDDASQWFSSLGQELQDFEAPPAPESDFGQGDSFDDMDGDTASADRPFADVPEVTSQDVSNVTNMRALQRPTAEVIVGTMDVLVPLLLAFIIKGSERDDAKLTPEEHDTLVEAWTGYLGDKNVQLSPGTTLIVALLTIYGSKVMIAVNHRAEKNEITRLRAQVEEQRAALEQKDKQIEIARQRAEEARK